MARKGTATAVKAEQIEELRKEGASWKAVAEALGLGNPGAARRTYTELTGRSHNDIDGVEVKRQPKAEAVYTEEGTCGYVADHESGTPCALEADHDGECIPVGAKKVRKYAPTPAPAVDLHPHWNPDSDQDQIIEALESVVKVGDKGKRVLEHAAKITVERSVGKYVYQEVIIVGHLKGLKWEADETKLAAEFWEWEGNFRTIDVEQIVEVTRV